MIKNIDFLIQHLKRDDPRLYEALRSLFSDLLKLAEAMADNCTCVIVHEILLTSNIPITVTLSDPIGAVVIYMVSQDSVGGHTVTFGPEFDFEGVPSEDQVRPDPNGWSAFIFLKRSNMNLRAITHSRI